MGRQSKRFIFREEECTEESLKYATLLYRKKMQANKDFQSNAKILSYTEDYFARFLFSIRECNYRMPSYSTWETVKIL